MNANEIFTEWLADGDVERVVAGLRVLCKKNLDKERATDINFEAGRFKTLKNNQLRGIVSHDEYFRELAKIRLSLQGIIQNLPENWLSEGLDSVMKTPVLEFQPPHEMRDLNKPSNLSLFRRNIGFIGLIVGIASIIIATVQPFRGNNGEVMQLTVYVQGIDGKPIADLQNQGQIIVDFGNDRRSLLIGEKGRTNFGEIPDKFRGEPIPITLQTEGYVPVDPGKKYVMDGTPIYFLVQRDNSLGLIQGIVKDRSGETLLAKVLILIDNDTFVFTDTMGRFRMQMPPAKQRDTYYLSLQKKGFKVKNEYYKPNTVPIEIRLEKNGG